MLKQKMEATRTVRFRVSGFLLVVEGEWRREYGGIPLPTFRESQILENGLERNRYHGMEDGFMVPLK